MQNLLTLVLPIKSPDDAKALVTLVPQLMSDVDKNLKELKTVHFLRVVIMDDYTKAVIAVEFDGDIVKYLQDIVQFFAPVFNALFPHVADAPPVPIEDPQNSQAFIDYSQKHNVPPVYFFSAYPDLTVVDILNTQQ